MRQDISQGQHFMVDEELLSRIVKSAYIDETDVILEIGSGSGNLTKYLIAAQPKQIICVEKDERFSISDPRVQMIHGSILEHIKNISCTTVVANIPYHISEPLLIGLIKKHIPKMVLVTGKTFADHITGKTILGTVLAHIYTIEVLEYIAPAAFDPPPKVDSALLRLRIKNNKEEDLFLEFFYTYQTSKLKNVFERIYEGKYTKKTIKEKVSALDTALLEKPLYTLSTPEFLQIHNFIKQQLL